jgi:hypothetical protein
VRPAPSRQRQVLIGALYALPLVALLALALRGVDPGRVLALVTGNPLLLLVPLPYLASQVFDALGSRRVVDAPVSLGRFLVVRMCADAVAFSLPSGPAFGEATAVHLLSTRSQVPAAVLAAGLVLRRLFLVLGHGSVLLLGAWLGRHALLTASASLLGGLRLDLLAALLGVLLLGLASGAALWVRGGRAARALLRLTARVAGRRARFLQRALRRAGQGAQGGLLRPPGRLLGTLACFVASMLVDGFETFLILHLLGAGLGYGAVLSFETLLSLLRALAFLLPAGLGLQDLGYLAFLAALGVPEATVVGAAFLVLKRGKELLWIAVGLLLLGLPRAEPRIAAEAA